jgi:hypothetical protein
MPPSVHTLITILLNIGILYVIYLFFIQKKVEGLTQPLDKNKTGDLLSIDTTSGSLCSLYASQPQVLNGKCGTLTEKNCNATSCCIWLNGASCVAGDASGPTFRTSKGKPIDVKSYSYQNTTF